MLSKSRKGQTAKLAVGFVTFPHRSAAVPAAPGRQDACDEGPHIRFRHLWGKTKRQQLLESGAQNGKALYDELTPPLDLGLPFAPAQVTTGLSAMAVATQLFPNLFAGVQSKRDRESVIDIKTATPLIERMKAYFNPEIGHEDMQRICPRALQPTARFEARQARDYLLKTGSCRRISSHIVTGHLTSGGFTDNRNAMLWRKIARLFPPGF